MEDLGVIEQDCDHIDFDVEETGKIIVEEKVEKVEKKEKKEKKKNNKNYPQRCKFIKKNGQQCRQRGKPNQSGGPIINGYCNYHRQNP
tara:strand:+ start:1802 stop:2065 length:264 start_codon:yes stop_codon:yes gene_type:complete